MMGRHTYRVLIVFPLIAHLLWPGCRRKPELASRLSTEDSIRIVRNVFHHRAEVDSFFRFSPESPFNTDTSVRYEGIRWFPPDPRYYFESKLYRYERRETVTVFGTRRERRAQLKYGYFDLSFEGKSYRVNVYKYLRAEAERKGLSDNYLAVWFTDETTGKETYEVGRYVEVREEQPDTNTVYVINLNEAYNPYCAYSSSYTCAVPRNEDHLDFRVLAGEMKYHK